MEDTTYIRMRKIADILAWFPVELQSDVFAFLTKAYFPELCESHPVVEKAQRVTGYIDESDRNIFFEDDDEVDEVDDNNPYSVEIDQDIESPSRKQDSTKRTRKRPPSKTYSPDTSLNLKGDDTTPSLRDFCSQFDKVTSNNVKFATVAVYYLREEKDINPVTMQQVMTCFREMSVKPYADFRVTFRNAKSEGYLVYEGDTVDLTQLGKNLVEFDLPRVVEGTE